MGEWTVPGYVVEELIGRGATATVWRGRDLDSGRQVALKRIVKVAAQPTSERIRAEVQAQTGARGPGALPVLDVVTLDNSVVVVSPLAAVTLRSLVAHRGRLSPGEVVAVTSSIGAALTRAHAAGVSHGDVAPANVLFDHAGTPLLGDFGQARCLMQDAPAVVSATPNVADPRLFDGITPDAAADVFGLAATAYFALGGRPLWIGEGDAGVAAAARSGLRPALARLAPAAPPALIAAIESGLHPDASARPGIAELVAAIRASCPALPVMIAAVAPTPADRLAAAETRPVAGRHATRAVESPPDERTVRPSWLIPVAAVAVLALVGSIAAGLAWGRHSGQRPAALHPVSQSANSSTNADWLTVVRRLARLRTQAILSRDPTLLAQVYVAGSKAELADARTISRLVAGGLKPTALHTDIQVATLLNSASGRATVRVVMTTSAWRIVDPATANTVALAPDRDRATVQMVLVATKDGWRIASLQPLA